MNTLAIGRNACLARPPARRGRSLGPPLRTDKRVGTGAATNEIVIEFHGIPQCFEDLVQDEMLASLECVRSADVLARRSVAHDLVR